MVTLSDVLRSVKKLKEETERLESKLNQTDRQVQIEKAKLNSFIAKIQQELLMGKKHLLNKQSLCIMQSNWTVGPKPVGQNYVSTIRPKYYDIAENRRAEMRIRPKNIIVIALLLTVYY